MASVNRGDACIFPVRVTPHPSAALRGKPGDRWIAGSPASNTERAMSARRMGRHGSRSAIEVNTRARVIITPAGAVDQLSAVTEAGGGRVEETLS